MAPSNGKKTAETSPFQVGTLVWVRADKADLAEDEVGEIVGTDLAYWDPATGADVVGGGLMVKLKISNVRGIFAEDRVRLFREQAGGRGEGGGPGRDQDGPATPVPTSRRRRGDRRAGSGTARNVTPSPVMAADGTSSPDTAAAAAAAAAVATATGGPIQKTARHRKVAQTSKAATIVSKTKDGGTKDAAAKERSKHFASKNERSNLKCSDSSDEDSEKDVDDDEEEEQDEPLVSLKHKGSGRRKEGSSSDGPTAAGGNYRRSATTSAGKGVGNMIVASETDSDDEKDMPFRVEYASTGRSTCRSCDNRIDKGVMRVSSRPLFRGKPGFVVYRHLQCQVFPGEIQRMQDVGGWRKLTANDKEILQHQVDESRRLVEEENDELDADELVQTAFQGEIRKAPEGLAATLLPFQAEGVSWMYNQEHTEGVRGGILADEMGMGKTIQTITTILDNRPKLQHSKPGAKHPPSAPDIVARKREEGLWEETLKSCHYDLKMANVPESALNAKKTKGAAPIGVRGGTIVCCPLIALYQWREEIEKFTTGDALSVCIYHGNDRKSKFPRDILAKYDIVLTTYQVLEMDFRKMVSPNKVKCPNCGRGFKIDKLAVHLKYFCGETAQRTEAQSRQRRTADRNQGEPTRGGRGGGSSNSKKKPMKSLPSKQTSTKEKIASTSTTKAAKKTVRARKIKGYDSDSDLSVAEDVDMSSSKRPSRSAARTASKRMTASSKDWAGNDSESESFSEDSTDDESSDDAAVPITKAKSVGQRASGVIDDSSDESESEDEAAIARATKRQKLAFEEAKNKKGKVQSRKTFKKTSKKTTRGKTFKAKKGSEKKPLPSSDESSSEDDDSSGGEQDPLEGVDMEALREEALEGCELSLLHTMCWWRIVLDEAHMIKSRSSQTASAAFHLPGVHRWALSGTPLQNRVGELYSLIRFLRIEPMAHYFCRRDGCGCKSIYYRMENGKCKDCGCASSQHFSYFNKHVLNVIQREGYTGDGRRAMMKLKTEVLDTALLRRTKESRAEDMNLPPRVVTIKSIRLHPREDDFYNALYTQTKSSFDDYVAEGTLLNNYAHIFDLLTKMRQAVDHPYLIVHSKKNHAIQAATGQRGPAVANGSTVCEICDETPTDRILSSCCGSAFCRSCVTDMMSLENLGDQDSSTRCPGCRAPFSIDLNQECQQIVDDATLTVSSSAGNDKAGMPSLKEMSHVASGSILRRIDLGEFATSTKIEALVQELVQMRTNRHGSKALVFSQFVNFLDLVRWRLHSDPCLQDLGLGVRIIHGGMNIQSRDEALRDFREDSSVRVLLMSLKAGGVALNLTVANEAYLLDPWWNPAAEMQAIDRTHRLGQYRPIRAVRFIAEGTVEERVLQLQEKKRLVFDGTVGRDAASLKMLTVDDMRALFT